jgi:hypothetical protein
MIQYEALWNFREESAEHVTATPKDPIKRVIKNKTG